MIGEIAGAVGKGLASFSDKMLDTHQKLSKKKKKLRRNAISKVFGDKWADMYAPEEAASKPTRRKPMQGEISV